ncbi:MAG: hypothetical protein FD176_611 [Rhodospirillaceae bacterium]|nr:MAG: hypothetical protein FD176_611 [Rhodospirillaceae bacterium]TNC94704.1 MAG: Uncharacterized protein FD119_2948 [Stygiobacter sp.]
MNTQRPHCGWVLGKGQANDLDGLHGILLCATRRGCDTSVECSERALELVLNATRAQIRQECGEDSVY